MGRNRDEDNLFELTNKPHRFWRSVLEDIGNSKNLGDLRSEIEWSLNTGKGFCYKTVSQLNKESDLESENKRLKEALKKISNLDDISLPPTASNLAYVRGLEKNAIIAKQALDQALTDKGVE